jgi:hypothetical protein
MPGSRFSGTMLGLSAMMRSTLVPVARAMLNRVSPGCTVHRMPVGHRICSCWILPEPGFWLDGFPERAVGWRYCTHFWAAVSKSRVRMFLQGQVAMPFLDFLIRHILIDSFAGVFEHRCARVAPW